MLYGSDGASVSGECVADVQARAYLSTGVRNQEKILIEIK